MHDSRMAAVNRLAMGVAHEINNPLSFIVGNVAYLSEELSRHHEILGDELVGEWRSALSDLSEGVVRVRDIVQELGGIADNTASMAGPVDVAAVLDSTLAMVHNRMRHRARLVREYSEVDRAWGSASQLSQVFLNLLLNAIDAVGTGDPKDNEIRVSLRSSSRGAVVVEIRDTGPGIDDSVLPQIFDPFFTTKPVGAGTGMGLTMSHRIVTELGGHITVRSKEGQGTSFIVTLPTHDALARAHKVPERVVDSEASGARILVVDDQAAVTRTVRRILRSHDVVTASSGREALRLLRKDDFDLVLCDLMMPDLSGQQLYDLAIEKQPHLAARFVFITGGAFTATAARFVKRVPNPVIEKPFSPQKLRELVARSIASLG